MRRIIFVDDEALNLTAARRVINTLEKWDATYANSAKEALQILEKETFDCIVSDLNMPEASGAELLEKVKDLHPDIVRMIFTASQPSECLSLSKVAHQIWNKPWDLLRLLDSLERILDVQGLLKNSNFRNQTGGVDCLPSVPSLVLELTAILDCSDASAGDVAKVIESDPALSAKILQVVNSAFFGISRRISNIREGVIRLGMNTIRNLVWSESIYRSFEASKSIPGFDIEYLQSKSVLTARVANEIFLDRYRQDDAFASALLMSVGQLILASEMPEYFASVLREAELKKRPLHQVEFEMGGVHHAAVGAYLLSLWGLPLQIVDAVAHQFESRDPTNRQFDVSDAVHIAARLVDGVIPDTDNSHGPKLEEEWLNGLDVTSDDLESWQKALAQNLAPPFRSDFSKSSTREAEPFSRL